MRRAEPMSGKMEIIASGNKMGLKNVYTHRGPDRH